MHICAYSYYKRVVELSIISIHAAEVMQTQLAAASADTLHLMMTKTIRKDSRVILSSMITYKLIAWTKH